MDSERQSKRRKLDTPTSSAKVSGNPTSTPKEESGRRRSRRGLATESPVPNGSAGQQPTNEGRINGQDTTNTNGKNEGVGKLKRPTRARTNGTQLVTDGVDEDIPPIGNTLRLETTTKTSRERKRVSSTVESQAGPDEEVPNGNGLRHEAGVDDVSMVDVGTPPADSDDEDGSVQGQQTRTSGRKRQVSRKLLEASIDPPSVKSSRTKAVKAARSPAFSTSELEKKTTHSKEAPPKLKRRRKLSDLSNRFVENERSSSAAPTMENIEVPPHSETLKPGRPRKTPTKSAREPATKINEVEPAEQQIPPITKQLIPVIAPELKPTVLATEHETQVAFDGHLMIEPRNLTTIRDQVLRRLTGRAPSQLVGLDDEYAKIANLVQQTITVGESNSMMIVGARGSGKSALLDSILDQQRQDNNQDFYVVRLSGFIHTDDKLALRDIWRQLGREMEIEDEAFAKNFADTLTMLLALLSHPSEIGQQEEGRTAKSTIIILEEFELFASHPRQTLLYNLFDIAQARKAPIAVLGLTTRFDVAESLEKRVKSRYSHRQVFIPLARNFALFRDMCRSALICQKDGSTEALDQPAATPKSKASRKALPYGSLEEARLAWNATIKHLFETSEALSHHLHQIFYTTKSVPEFQTSMLLPIGTLPTDDTDSQITTSLVLSHLTSAIKSSPSLRAPDSRLSLLPSFSTLQLSLLIAAARLPIIHDAETCTFALAYDEYKSLASKARITASAMGALATGSGARVWSQSPAASAWEGLIDAGLILPVNERRAGDKTGLCRADVSLEEIGMCYDSGRVEMGAVMAKWCKEI